jgi:hypothetical protein
MHREPLQVALTEAYPGHGEACQPHIVFDPVHHGPIGCLNTLEETLAAHPPADRKGDLVDFVESLARLEMPCVHPGDAAVDSLQRRNRPKVVFEES